eukprot:gene13019-8865_t
MQLNTPANHLKASQTMARKTLPQIKFLPYHNTDKLHYKTQNPIITNAYSHPLHKSTPKVKTNRAISIQNPPNHQQPTYNHFKAAHNQLSNNPNSRRTRTPSRNHPTPYQNVRTPQTNISPSKHAKLHKPPLYSNRITTFKEQKSLMPNR